MCEELQLSEMKKQPDVRSDSVYHKFVTVSSTSLHVLVCKVFNDPSLHLYFRRLFKVYLSNFRVSKLLYLDKTELQ